MIVPIILYQKECATSEAARARRLPLKGPNGNHTEENKFLITQTKQIEKGDEIKRDMAGRLGDVAGEGASSRDKMKITRSATCQYKAKCKIVVHRIAT